MAYIIYVCSFICHERIRFKAVCVGGVARLRSLSAYDLAFLLACLHQFLNLASAWLH